MADPQLLYYVLPIALLIPIILLLTRKSSSRFSGLRLPPGPWQLPVVGSIHHMTGALPHHAMRNLANRHGPVMFLKFGEIPILVVSSAEADREVMKTHDVIFATRPVSRTSKVLMKDSMGVVMAPYGDHWRQLRKICILELLSTSRVQSFRRVREEEVARLIESVSSGSASSSLVNVSETLRNYVTDSAVRAIIGSRFKDREGFWSRLEEGLKITGAFSLANFFPSSRLAGMVSQMARRAKRHQKSMFEYMDGIVQEHEQNRATGDGDDQDLLDVLLRIQKEGGLQFPLTMGTIKAVILDLFAAGSETSATAMQWAMSELMRFPRVMQKVQEEVRRVVGEQQGKLTEEVLPKLSYFPLVIKETLRMHPPAPLLLPRECRETCQILGYDVPKGTMVLVNAWAIGRDSKYWEDPEEFKPERFEGSTVDFKGTDFEFVPFGAGRRICPGMSFGLANIELAFASLLFHFDWELPDGMKPSELDMTEALALTARRSSDLCLRAISHVPPYSYN